MQADQKFNVRVYGLIRWENQVLVSDEYLWGKPYTKFPGGGLEWGEGISACLKREIMEELKQEISNEKLFYLTEFFQESAYNKSHQIISIYYTAECHHPQAIPVSTQRFNFQKSEHGEQVFRWQKIEALNPADFHFPIDKVVVEKLLNSL